MSENGRTHLVMGVSGSLVVTVEGVVGLRRESCLRLETPASLLKDELDLFTL